MVKLYYGPRGKEGLPAHLVRSVPGIKREVKAEAKKVEIRAETNLQAARAASTHTRIEPTPIKTEIKLEPAPGRMGADWLVSLYAPNAFALEYGHYPSGYFDPLKYGTITKSPSGLYILNRAAGFPAQNIVSAPTRKGQNARSKKARKQRWNKRKNRNKKRNKKKR
jgi:hypothetical protein